VGIGRLGSDLGALRREDFGLREAYAGPRTSTESDMTDVWQKAMRIDRVGIHDSFFELGGKSFSAAVIFGEIERKYRVRLPMAVLLELQTVALLSGKIDELSRQ
jgi:acyl carrier protein